MKRKLINSLLGITIFFCLSLVILPAVNANQIGDPGANSNAGALSPCADNEVQTDFGCFPNDPVGFTQKFYGFGLGFIGMCALLGLILGGYDVMTSKGNPHRLNVGKSYIYYSIAGLLLAIFGFVIIQGLMVDILKVPGFK